MKFDVIRAWKDEAYRQSLPAEAQAQLPENPAGSYELNEADLEAVYGAAGPYGYGYGREVNLSQYSNCSNAVICRQSANGTNNFACFSNGFGSDCNNVDTRSANGALNFASTVIGLGNNVG